ncbi:MAG: hypothetical protein HRF50_00230 [Phycisphaerae bacterium]|jgi:hypothetical protein
MYRSPASTLTLIGCAGLLAFAAGGCPPGTNPADCNEPSATGKPVDVHLFRYDADTDEYLLGDKRVAAAAVKRDLAGELCGKCHAQQVAELKDSVHFRWASTNERILFPGGGAHGMLDRACGLPASTALINYTSDVQIDECGKCHAGRFLPVMEPFFAAQFEQMGLPDPQGQAARLVEGGLDCLICHAEEYASVPADNPSLKIAGYAEAGGASPTAGGDARSSHDDTDFDGDGQPDALIDMNGDGVADAPLMQDRDGDGQPETPWPTVAQDRSFAAVSSIGATNDETCLRCHEHARTGYKRGTLFRAGHDVHAVSPAVAAIGGGEHRHCVACHTVEHHKFRRGDSVGGDIMAADYAVGSAENQLTCTTCHDTGALPKPVHMKTHLDKLACETCHIPYSSGITYALWGQGANLTFGRSADGQDTKVITLDHYLNDGTDEDVNTDWEAFRTYPTLTWFNGNVSFLAQTLALRTTPGAKITPFKPMANGMVFDARYFNGQMVSGAAMDGQYQYNAHTMFRFQADGANADIFEALGFLTLSADEVRGITLNDFLSADPDRQAMAFMQIFPNLVFFDKSTYGYVRYQIASGSPFDADHNGFVDVGAAFNFDMLAAANNGLRAFQGFNGPMGLPADYSWYPPYETGNDLVSMKLPDGTDMKIYLSIEGMKLPADQQPDHFAALENYPAFSNGITLGGHGVRPKSEALGANLSCVTCHAAGGVMDHPVPVTRTVPRDVPGFGTFQFPVYRWRYYQVHAITDLGLTTRDEDIAAGSVSVDIAGDDRYRRQSSNTIVVNYMNPAGEGSYRPADHADALAGTGLTPSDLTMNGGEWMPALEPDVDYVPNYRILGYTADEILFMQ